MVEGPRLTPLAGWLQLYNAVRPVPIGRLRPKRGALARSSTLRLRKMSSSRGKRPIARTRKADYTAPRSSAAAAAGSDRDQVRAALMAKTQAGNSEAYRQLLNDITPFVRALAVRRLREANEVEDAVQDVLLTVHRIRHTYDPVRPFAPWLAAIANRRITDRLRRQIRANSRLVPLGLNHETLSVAEPNSEAAGSDAAALRTAIEALPSGQRQAIEMLKLGEMSLKEAAATTEMSIAALKGATHRALATLKKRLGYPRRSP